MQSNCTGTYRSLKKLLAALKEPLQNMHFRPILAVALILLLAAAANAQTKRKVIIDQDARGPQPRTSNRFLSSCNHRKWKRLGSRS